jgi:hypothetical protein
MNATYRFATAVAIAFTLSACTIARIPVDSLNYQGTAAVKSMKTASVTVRSSGIGSRQQTTMMPVGGIQIPTTQKSAGEAFNAQDQQEFEQSLKKELVRLGIFSSATMEASAADIGVLVNINYSTSKTDFVEYTLNLTLTLTGGKAPFQKTYVVSSLEGDTIWQKMDTNGAQATVKVAQKTLNKMVPDIEAYVRDAVR